MDLKKRNRSYRKIFSANALKVLSVLLALEFLWAVVIQMKEKDTYVFFCSLIYVFAFLAFYCAMDIWKNRIIWRNCDFEALEEYLHRLAGRKKYRENIKVHLELLFTSLVLGRYDESGQEIEKLQSVAGRLNNKQKLELWIWNIDYMISTNKTEFLKEELEKAGKFLEQLDGIRNKVKHKIMARIRIRQYLLEERWEDILELQKDISELPGNATVFEQISMAYIKGMCYYRLGRYEEAFMELQFTARWGGSTKYVLLANDLIEKIPKKNLYDNKYVGKIKSKIDKKSILLIVICFLILLSGTAAYYCSIGGSIEEAYCRRYLQTQNEPVVFYSKSIGKYELAILSEEKKMGYCLFQKTSGSGYRIVDSFRVDKYAEDYAMEELEKTGMDIPISMKEFYLESRVKQEIWAVITEFYRKNDIFYEESMEYIGFSYSPLVKDMKINGKPVSVEQMNDMDEVPIYLWSVKDIDLKKEIFVD